jgi:branched-chain amino acid transport system ATP-binding protein
MKGETSECSVEGGAPALVARDLVCAFSGIRAVDAVSLEAHRGEILGLIGPNGAGKSTLFSLLAGERVPTHGSIEIGGHVVTREPAAGRLARGLGRTFQVPRPFLALSVLENVMLGAQGHPGESVVGNLLFARGVRARERSLRDEAMRWLEFTTLAPLARAPAQVLSIGQRKLLELARVLMAHPQIVLLDEPMAGVQPALVALLADRLATLAQGGTTVLLVEHQLSLIASLCHRVIVMAAGRILLTGSPADVLADPTVAEAYLGMAVP